MSTAAEPPRPSAAREPPAAAPRVDSRLQVLYLLAVGAAVFVVSSVWILGVLVGAQIVLWLAAGYSRVALLRPLQRLMPLAGVLALTTVLFAGETARTDAGGWAGLVRFEVVIPVLRLIAVVLASQLVRQASEGRDFVTGLARLGLPLSIAVALETTLHLVGGGDPRAARRSGGGRRRMAAAIGRLLRGDIGFLVETLQRRMESARSRLEPLRNRLGTRRLDDLVVICAVAAVSAAVRLVRILPGLPVAPGHKSVVVIPLYVVAGAMTHSRWGASQAGVVMGITAFLMGDGRFGIFEVAKFVTPGLVVDALLPVLRRRGEPGKLAYAALGLLAGLCRFSTILLVALFIAAPPGFLALLIPIGIAHALFGALSGIVSAALIRGWCASRARAASREENT